MDKDKDSLVSSNKASKLPQVFAAFSGIGDMLVSSTRGLRQDSVVNLCAVAFGGFSLGAAISWSSPALLYMNEELCGPKDECDISGISAEMASWIASSVSLGALFSGTVSCTTKNFSLCSKCY